MFEYTIIWFIDINIVIVRKLHTKQGTGNKSKYFIFITYLSDIVRWLPYQNPTK